MNKQKKFICKLQIKSIQSDCKYIKNLNMNWFYIFYKLFKDYQLKSNSINMNFYKNFQNIKLKKIKYLILKWIISVFFHFGPICHFNFN